MKKDVSTPSAASELTAQQSALPRALMDGTDGMRKAGKLYLPQEPAESDIAYKIRLSRSVLYNAFAKAVQNLTGKVFECDIVIGDDVPEDIKGWLENCDLAGRDLTQFAKALFEDALVSGLSLILVDYPPGTPAQTRADEAQSGRRPYLVHVKAENLIGFRSTVVNGVEVLTQVRIREAATVNDGKWGELSVDQIRVLEPGIWQIWRANEKGNWIKVDEGTTTLSFIPLVPFYTNRIGFFTAKPPLADLAHLNCAHWQSSSDQRHILHVARVPILFGAGLDTEDGKKELGVNRLWTAAEPTAKLTFVEHTGAAIGAGRDDLKDLEERMSILGMQPMLKSKTGAQTATEKAIDTAESESALQSWAHSLEDALELAIDYMGQWVGKGKDASGTVEVNDDFGTAPLDSTVLVELGKARAAGDLSRKNYLQAFIAAGGLPEDFDYEANDEELDNEGPALGTLPPAPVPKKKPPTTIKKNPDGSMTMTEE